MTWGVGTLTSWGFFWKSHCCFLWIHGYLGRPHPLTLVWATFTLKRKVIPLSRVSHLVSNLYSIPGPKWRNLFHGFGSSTGAWPWRMSKLGRYVVRGSWRSLRCRAEEVGLPPGNGAASGLRGVKWAGLLFGPVLGSGTGTLMSHSFKEHCFICLGCLLLYFHNLIVCGSINLGVIWYRLAQCGGKRAKEKGLSGLLSKSPC